MTILQGDGALAVEIKQARDSNTGVLRWDQPPSLRRVAGVLPAHLGRSITSVGDLDIPDFYGSELRQHACRLLDGGDARGEWRALVRSEPGVGPHVPNRVIAPEPDGFCGLCDDYGPRVAYHQPGGKSFDCTRSVKRFGSRSGIAPADPRHRSRPAARCAALVTRGRDLEFVMGRAVCDWIGWKR